MMTIQPLNERVVLKRLKSEDRSSGGIIIPDAAQEKATRAAVVSVGPGKLLEDGTRVPIGVKVGDVVLFGKYSGTEFTLDGEEVLVVGSDDILGVVEERV